MEIVAVRIFDDKGNDWSQHWFDMPEFVQGKIEPFATITVRVETEADLRELEARLEQKLTAKTKSIWFPYKPHRLPVKKVWRNAE